MGLQPQRELTTLKTVFAAVWTIMLHRPPPPPPPHPHPPPPHPHPPTPPPPPPHPPTPPPPHPHPPPTTPTPTPPPPPPHPPTHTHTTPPPHTHTSPPISTPHPHHRYVFTKRLLVWTNMSKSPMMTKMFEVLIKMRKIRRGRNWIGTKLHP